MRVGGGRVEVPPRSRDGRYETQSVHDLRFAGKRWRARPDTELHATAQKKLMMFSNQDHSKIYWPVYKGKSFNIWVPDTGDYYAWANPEPVIEWLQLKRSKARRNSVHQEFSEEYRQDQSTLPCYQPRIAFRDITHGTAHRTIIAALVPPKIFITNTAPYFLWPRGDKKDEAFLLGVLCSIPLDWYAKCFVELHVNYFVINPFPIPRPGRDNSLWQRTVSLAGRLACPDKRFANWAAKVGVDHGPLAEDEKEDMIHELDAVVAHLYGLDERQLVHVFKTFHHGWDHTIHLKGVLKHYSRWAGK